MKPATINKRNDDVYLSYELPYRVHVAKAYPITAPNGSSIILYGHKGGLTIAWRGGKAFRKQQPKYDTTASSKPTASGHGSNTSDAIMIIDSDEEDQDGQTKPAEKPTEEVAFEEGEEQSDTSSPSSHILDMHTFQLDTDVTHLAVPPLSVDASSWTTEALPPPFNEKIIVAAACLDSSVRMFTLPLTPIPGYEPGNSKNEANTRESKVFAIHGMRAGNGHAQSEASTKLLDAIVTGLSLTWTMLSPRSSASDSDPDGDPKRNRRSARSTTLSSLQWHLVVSWTSGHAQPLLRSTSISFEELETTKQSSAPIVSEHLPAPTTALSFTTSRYPSPRHALLLIGDTKSTVRIYDPLGRTSSRVAQSQQELAQKRGTWLTTLMGPFDHKSTTSAPLAPTVPSRARILDAQWAFDGKCILVLLAGGQWGIWDLEGVGPKPAASKREALTHNAAKVVSGSGITPFAIRAYLANDDTVRLGFSTSTANSTKNSTASTSTGLTPMTPNTRKSKQTLLFTASSTSASSLSATQQEAKHHPSPSRGGLSVSQLPATEPSQLNVESVAFWYGSQTFAIPNLMQYWSQAISRSATNKTAPGIITGPMITALEGVHTLGEMITSIAQFPSSRTTRFSSHSSSLEHDILISAEHRLGIYVPFKPTSSGGGLVLRGLFDPASSVESNPRREPKRVAIDTRERIDRDLLRRGELDLDGLDRMVDGMASGADDGDVMMSGALGPGSRANGDAPGKGLQGLFPDAQRPRRKVGFAMEY